MTGGRFRHESGHTTPSSTTTTTNLCNHDGQRGCRSAVSSACPAKKSRLTARPSARPSAGRARPPCDLLITPAVTGKRCERPSIGRLVRASERLHYLTARPTRRVSHDTTKDRHHSQHDARPFRHWPASKVAYICSARSVRHDTDQTTSIQHCLLQSFACRELRTASIRLCEYDFRA